MEKKLIALQTVVILPIIIITSAWIFSVLGVLDGVCFFALTGGTFFGYEIFFNHYCELDHSGRPSPPNIPIPTPQPPTEGATTTPESMDVNLLREIRDLLRNADEDSYFINLSTTLVSLFAGLVAVTALLLAWFQMSTSSGLSSEVQKTLGTFGNYIIDLEIFFIGLIVICTFTPVVLRYVKKRRNQSRSRPTSPPRV